MRSLAIVVCISAVGCDDSTAVKEPPPDASPPPLADAGPTPEEDGGAPDCFTNPTTHFEIINACTDAVKILKDPTLPRLLPDGGLPPLQ